MTGVNNRLIIIGKVNGIKISEYFDYIFKTGNI